MSQRYALPVYFLIVGTLSLGYLQLPLLAVVLASSRDIPPLPIAVHPSYTKNRDQQSQSLSCTHPISLDIEQQTNEQLSQELMEVFGHDSLWQRAQQPQPTKKLGKSAKHHSHKISATPSPLSASWTTISSWLPFSNDLDLGANSETDIYVQFLAKKRWALHSGLHLNTEQIFRYGSSSKNYTETHLNLTRQFQQQNQLSTQFNFSKTQDTEYIWSNRTFQKLNLLSQNNLTYGIFSTGDYENKALRVNEWGPYFSWKRPIWRNWIYMQNDINYVNMPATEQGYYFNYQMKFEAHF